MHIWKLQLLTRILTGNSVGQKIEDDFTQKAKEAGLTEEEVRSAFNQNMMATGMLSEHPKEFAKEHNRRWLVSAYEAGDVVLHKAHAVGNIFPHTYRLYLYTKLILGL
jgi:hypothetical protein